MNAWVFLSGPMGAGKSTLGRALAERRGARFVDLDARIEVEQGRSVAQIFAADGEAGFRRIEAETALALLEETPAVVALGGGTVTEVGTRHALLAAGTLVTLTAPLEVLHQRLGSGRGRPLADRLAALMQARADAYAECHGRVSTDARLEVVLDDIERLLEHEAVVVPLGRRSYRVGFESIESLPDEVSRLEPTHVVVVTDTNVDPHWGERIARSLDARVKVVLDAGEEHKTIRAVERVWDAALDAGVDRDALVVAVGGGVVGDLAGFAAASLLRGVRFLQVPTTTLAMVDASVGGKTGFDRRHGKNLVGAFHQPEHVRIDVETLSTLPDVELKAGLAEVVKSAWLDSESAVEALERDAERLLARDPDALGAAIRRSVELKARIVAADELEGGLRRVLNLGHTVGHAIEASRSYRGIRHGEAVSLGLIAAFRVARRLGDADAEAHEVRIRALLERLELPVDLEAWWDEGARSFLGADKKRTGDEVRFIVPGAPGEVRVQSLPLTHEFGP